MYTIPGINFLMATECGLFHIPCQYSPNCPWPILRILLRVDLGVSQAIWREIWKLSCLPSLYSVSVEKLWTQNTRIIHDVWRLLILSNEENRMIYMKILKKGGRRKRNPCPMRLWWIVAKISIILLCKKETRK